MQHLTSTEKQLASGREMFLLALDLMTEPASVPTS
jgi:hypothetical protein